MAIEYISNENIDFKKWDRCIKKSFNGNIYAYSWYLNVVTDKWSALVENDYERIMPLPNSKLLGKDLIVHPRLTGQLGIFSTTTLNESNIQNFINYIPSRYKYVNLQLNKHNRFQNSHIESSNGINMDIDLIKPYEKLREIYPQPLKELLDFANKRKFKVIAKIPVEYLADFDLKSYLHSFLHPEEVITMHFLVAAAIDNKMGQICGLYGEKDKLLGLGVFVWSHQKATILFNLFDNKKLQLPALFFFIDDFIRNNSEKNLILHIELNAHSKLVSLLEKIGAKKSESFYYYRNQLPWYLKPFVA